MFQLSKEEFENWKSHFATSTDKMGLRKILYPFTKQEVLMLQLHKRVYKSSIWGKFERFDEEKVYIFKIKRKLKNQ